MIPTGYEKTYTQHFFPKVFSAYSDTYTFYTYSDDGVRLWVNDKLVVDKAPLYNYFDKGASPPFATPVGFEFVPAPLLPVDIYTESTKAAAKRYLGFFDAAPRARSSISSAPRRLPSSASRCPARRTRRREPTSPSR